MGRGRTTCLDAVNSLRHPGIQSDLLGFLCGVRTLCHSVSIVRRGVGLATGWIIGRDAGAHAQHSLGVSFLLYRHHLSELEILLHPSPRLFVLNHAVLDFGGMAFSKASPKLMLCGQLLVL